MIKISCWAQTQRGRNPSKGEKGKEEKWQGNHSYSPKKKKKSLSNRKVEETKREKASITRMENILNLTIL